MVSTVPAFYDLCCIGLSASFPGLHDAFPTVRSRRVSRRIHRDAPFAGRRRVEVVTSRCHTSPRRGPATFSDFSFSQQPSGLHRTPLPRACAWTVAGRSTPPPPLPTRSRAPPAPAAARRWRVTEHGLIVGSRVVKRWSCRPGAISARTHGQLRRTRAAVKPQELVGDPGHHRDQDDPG